MIDTLSENKAFNTSLAYSISTGGNLYPFDNIRPFTSESRDKKSNKPLTHRTHAKKNMSNTDENQQHILADAALMEKVASGDNNACRIVIEKHSSAIYRIAYRVLHQQGEAEDVVQEAFVKLWQLAPKWKPQAKILTWLYRVATNAALDKVRKRPISKEVNLELYMPFAPATTSAEAPLENQEAQQQRNSTLQKALENLPKRYQMVINLFYFENLKVREIATVLKLTPRATESLLKRARGRLKLIYQKESLN